MKTHVLRLNARNVKCIREVAIDFDGAIHEIKGDAGQGKTTILQSIEGAMRGLDPSMVRQGSDAAEIELTLTDTQITRVLNADGKEKLSVTDADGNKVAKAKEFLKTICGPTAFRPIEWVRLGDTEGRGKTERLRRQRDMLLEAISVEFDLANLDQQISTELGPEHFDVFTEIKDVDASLHPFELSAQLLDKAYKMRATKNKEVEQNQTALGMCPEIDSVAPEEDAETLQAEHDRLRQEYWRLQGRQENRERLDARAAELEGVIEKHNTLPSREKFEKTKAHYQQQAQKADTEIQRLWNRINELQAEKQQAEHKLEEAKAYEERYRERDQAGEELATIKQQLTENGDDVSEVEANLTDVAARLETRRNYDMRRRYEEEEENARRQSELLTDLVEFFRDTLPNRLLEQATIPITGLRIENEIVTINGIPLNQLGTSEQIRTGVLVAAAINPNAGFVLVDGAESLGQDDLGELAKAAREHGLQLIMTTVDPHAETNDHTSVIQDGAVIESNP